jgi:hypothetical protein
LILTAGEKSIPANPAALKTDNAKLFGLEHTADRASAAVPTINRLSERETDL